MTRAPMTVTVLLFAATIATGPHVAAKPVAWSFAGSIFQGVVDSLDSVITALRSGTELYRCWSNNGHLSKMRKSLDGVSVAINGAMTNPGPNQPNTSPSGSANAVVMDLKQPEQWGEFKSHMKRVANDLGEAISAIRVANNDFVQSSRTKLSSQLVTAISEAKRVYTNASELEYPAGQLAQQKALTIQTQLFILNSKISDLQVSLDQALTDLARRPCQ
jgi:hypothetical protein